MRRKKEKDRSFFKRKKSWWTAAGKRSKREKIWNIQSFEFQIFYSHSVCHLPSANSLHELGNVSPRLSILLKMDPWNQKIHTENAPTTPPPWQAQPSDSPKHAYRHCFKSQHGSFHLSLLLHVLFSSRVLSRGIRMKWRWTKLLLHFRLCWTLSASPSASPLHALWCGLVGVIVLLSTSLRRRWKGDCWGPGAFWVCRWGLMGQPSPRSVCTDTRSHRNTGNMAGAASFAVT